MIGPGQRQVGFVRGAFANCGSVERILVVRPERNGCPLEPCEVLTGSIAPDGYHARQPGSYRLEREIACGKTERRIEVVFSEVPPPLPSPEGTVVIDWNDHVRREAKRLGIPWKALAVTSLPPGGLPRAGTR